MLCAVCCVLLHPPLSMFNIDLRVTLNIATNICVYLYDPKMSKYLHIFFNILNAFTMKLYLELIFSVIKYDDEGHKSRA